MMNGVINIHKPTGPSSFGVVQSLKRCLKVKKAGHIGTLDPLAEGVLPICLDRSTKIIQFLTHLSKHYTATLKLGTVTDTQDAAGKTLSVSDAGGITEEAVRSVMRQFIGPQKQIPPMYSAKKKNGIPLYKLARNGITIEREPSSICIYSLEWVGKEGEEVTFKVHCSSGTYIRSICHDIGARLGCGAHMVRLTRTRVGNFDIRDSLSLEEVARAEAEGNLSGRLFSMESALSFIPEIRVKKDRIGALAHGVALTKSAVESFPDHFKPGMTFRVNDRDNHLVAIVEPVIDEAACQELDAEDIAFKLKRVFL